MKNKSDLPFEELKKDNVFIRKFSENIDSQELHWHKDGEDRIVTPLKETDWLFQRDNQLPEPIIEGLKIKAGEWHRVIKGTGDLEIKVIKCY
jgi:hypothetical protein